LTGSSPSKQGYEPAGHADPQRSNKEEQTALGESRKLLQSIYANAQPILAISDELLFDVVDSLTLAFYERLDTR
jgi:hypothetical protein